MAEQWERTLPCKDALGRPRDLRVFITADGGSITIGLHTPPGDVARLEPRALARLHDVLAAARLEATHLGAEWQ